MRIGSEGEGKATVPTSKRVHFEGGNLAGSALALASSSAHSKSSLSIRKTRRRDEEKQRKS